MRWRPGHFSFPFRFYYFWVCWQYTSHSLVDCFIYEKDRPGTPLKTFKTQMYRNIEYFHFFSINSVVKRIPWYIPIYYIMCVYNIYFVIYQCILYLYVSTQVTTQTIGSPTVILWLNFRHREKLNPIYDCNVTRIDSTGTTYIIYYCTYTLCSCSSIFFSKFHSEGESNLRWKPE